VANRKQPLSLRHFVSSSNASRRAAHPAKGEFSTARQERQIKKNRSLPACGGTGDSRYGGDRGQVPRWLSGRLRAQARTARTACSANIESVTPTAGQVLNVQCRRTMVGQAATLRICVHRRLSAFLRVLRGPFDRAQGMLRGEAFQESASIRGFDFVSFCAFSRQRIVPAPAGKPRLSSVVSRPSFPSW